MRYLVVIFCCWNDYCRFLMMIIVQKCFVARIFVFVSFVKWTKTYAYHWPNLVQPLILRPMMPPSAILGFIDIVTNELKIHVHYAFVELYHHLNISLSIRICLIISCYQWNILYFLWGHWYLLYDSWFQKPVLLVMQRSSLR